MRVIKSLIRFLFRIVHKVFLFIGMDKLDYQLAKFVKNLAVPIWKIPLFRYWIRLVVKFYPTLAVYLICKKHQSNYMCSAYVNLAENYLSPWLGSVCVLETSTQQKALSLITPEIVAPMFLCSHYLHYKEQRPELARALLLQLCEVGKTWNQFDFDALFNVVGRLFMYAESSDLKLFLNSLNSEVKKRNVISLLNHTSIRQLAAENSSNVVCVQHVTLAGGYSVTNEKNITTLDVPDRDQEMYYSYRAIKKDDQVCVYLPFKTESAFDEAVFLSTPRSGKRFYFVLDTCRRILSLENTLQSIPNIVVGARRTEQKFLEETFPERNFIFADRLAKVEVKKLYLPVVTDISESITAGETQIDFSTIKRFLISKKDELSSVKFADKKIVISPSAEERARQETFYNHIDESDFEYVDTNQLSLPQLVALFQHAKELLVPVEDSLVFLLALGETTKVKLLTDAKDLSVFTFLYSLAGAKQSSLSIIPYDFRCIYASQTREPKELLKETLLFHGNHGVSI